MFGGATALNDADLADGMASLMVYSTMILADMLNAAHLLRMAERTLDKRHPDTQQLVTLALQNFLDIAEEAAVRARRARLVALGTDERYASGHDAQEELEGDEFDHYAVEEARFDAEHEAALAIARRPDLWERRLHAEDLVLSIAPKPSAAAPVPA